jgi:L-asparaginase / beta-aspartyl-peptidase
MQWYLTSIAILGFCITVAMSFLSSIERQMPYYRLLAVCLLITWGSWMFGDTHDTRQKIVLVIHGGAGAISKKKLTPELNAAYRADLEKSLKAGYAKWKEGGSSQSMVEASIQILEDSPLFNAGRGAAFNRDGRIEHSASIMLGKDRTAGAVAGLSRTRHPISAAIAVMEKSKHVLMIGESADRFVKSHGLEEVSPAYFWTEERWKQLNQLLEREKQSSNIKMSDSDFIPAFGTVGAVARDSKGNLTAGTSTGGMNGQLSGRVGDSPIIGAGTFADNEICGISGTGHGEVFIRFCVAHDVAARMKYKNQPALKAIQDVFDRFPKEEGGVGGVILLTPKGESVSFFNTEGMYRGTISEDGEVSIAIHEK